MQAGAKIQAVIVAVPGFGVNPWYDSIFIPGIVKKELWFFAGTIGACTGSTRGTTGGKGLVVDANVCQDEIAGCYLRIGKQTQTPGRYIPGIAYRLAVYNTAGVVLYATQPDLVPDDKTQIAMPRCIQVQPQALTIWL
jgi:hypothetical protein